MKEERKMYSRAIEEIEAAVTEIVQSRESADVKACVEAHFTQVPAPGVDVRIALIIEVVNLLIVCLTNWRLRIGRVARKQSFFESWTHDQLRRRGKGRRITAVIHVPVTSKP